MKQLSAKQIQVINTNFQQGQKSIQLGLFNQAEKHFLDILKLKPDVNEAQAALAYIYTVTKQHRKAEAKLKLLLKSNPNHAQTLFNLGNCLYEQQRHDEAIDYYQRTIKDQPSLIDAYINCGIAYRMLKQHDSAVQQLHHALNHDKTNARAFYILGMIYADIEDYPRALECLENARGLAPKNPDFHLDFANTLEKASLDHEAGTEYHKICESNPNHLDSFLLYSEYLLKSHRHDEALECLLHARNIEADNSKVISLLGKTYAGMNDTDAAIEQYTTGLDLHPNDYALLNGLGSVYQELGDSDKGVDIANKIIAVDKERINGYSLKARIKKSDQKDGLAEELNSITSRDDISDETKVHGLFALGKVYNDHKNFHNAFQAYFEGNRIKNSTINYDSVKTETSFQHIKDFFNADLIEQRKKLATENNLAVLIVGMPRSGTTLTEQIISSHPDVLGAGEVSFWGKAPVAMPLRMKSDKMYPECIKDLTTTQAQDIIDLYETNLKKIVGINNAPKHITDKMPQNFLNLGLISLIYPNAKIIHTKRNPIDTCLSIFFQLFSSSHNYAFSLENLGHYYKLYQDLMLHWHEALPNKIFDINYEDTISDPEYWSRQLIDQIGLEWNDACLAPHKLERTVKTASHWQVRQPIYKTSVQRWKNYEPYLQPLLDALK